MENDLSNALKNEVKFLSDFKYSFCQIFFCIHLQVSHLEFFRQHFLEFLPLPNLLIAGHL